MKKNKNILLDSINDINQEPVVNKREKRIEIITVGNKRVPRIVNSRYVRYPDIVDELVSADNNSVSQLDTAVNAQNTLSALAMSDLPFVDPGRKHTKILNNSDRNDISNIVVILAAFAGIVSVLLVQVL